MATPYLILDEEMINSICFSAKEGLDVRLLVPHIPDKKMVFNLTRSYYEKLLEAGVKIYEDKDFLQTIDVSHEVTLQEWKRWKKRNRCYWAMLRLISPIL